MESSVATLDLEVNLDDEAERVVKEIGIPPCPAILTRLVREMREDDPDLKRIGDLIGSDVGLAASIVKTVNSPFYGLAAKVTSVRQAIALMGLRNVGQLMTGLVLRQAFPSANSDAMERFWELSSGIARAAALVARTVRQVDRDDAYTFALFRDCGMALLMRKFRDYAALITDTETLQQTPLIELELLRYTIDHARVGYKLACSWHLSPEVCAAIQFHHAYAMFDGSDPELPASAGRLAALALVAEEVYMRCEHEGSCPDWGRGGPAALAALDLTEDDVARIAEEVAPELAQAS